MATRSYAVPGLSGNFDAQSSSGAVYVVPGGGQDIDVGGFIPPPPTIIRPWRRPDLLHDPEEDEFVQVRRRFAPVAAPPPPVVVASYRRRIELMESTPEPEETVEIWFPQTRPRPTKPKKMRPYLQLNA